MRSLRYGVDCYVLGDGGGGGGGSWQSLGPPLTAPPREDASEEGCDFFEGDPDRVQRADDDDDDGVDQDCGSDNLEGFLCVARGIDRVLS